MTWPASAIYVNGQLVWCAGMSPRSCNLKMGDVLRYEYVTPSDAVIAGNATYVTGEYLADLGERDTNGVPAATAAAAALSTVPCRCGPEYYERALVAPGCDHHDLADEMAGWLRCGCVGCQRLAAAESERYGDGP